jgi:hypothetical protein
MLSACLSSPKPKAATIGIAFELDGRSPLQSIWVGDVVPVVSAVGLRSLGSPPRRPRTDDNQGT